MFYRYRSAPANAAVHYRLLLMLAGLLLLAMPTSVLAAYGGGSGTVGDPYLISTAVHLEDLANPINSGDWNGYFQLTADLDMTGLTLAPIGNNSTKFTGSFDGNNHTISNLTTNLPSSNYVALFGYVNSYRSPSIFNLGLINPDITGNSSVGPLVGTLYRGTVSQCFVGGGTVNGAYGVGGLVGYNFTYGVISDCYATGAVTVSSSIGGGLVGTNYTGDISNCYASVVVGGTGSSPGGLVGSSSGTVSDSYWDTQISGQSTSAGGVGRTTDQMKMATGYTCWAASGLWTIDDGIEPPRLLWEGATGSLITPPSFSGGAGTLNDPYLIDSASQLLWIGCDATYWDKHFKLMADLDMTGNSMTPIGTNATSFTGSFDGNGFALANLTIDQPVNSFVGLFGVVNSVFEPTIFDLDIVNPNITGSGYVGSVTGLLQEGSVVGCYANGGTVDGGQNVGGLVGYISNYGTISNCKVSSAVTGTVSNIGGLLGYNNVGTITGCVATGTVTGTLWDTTMVGGLIGTSYNDINNSYATGAVTGYSTVGGLVANNFGVISNCYSTGLVDGTSGTLVGGLAGSNSGHIISSYWATDSTSQKTSAGGIGKTLDQMKQTDTFLGWGCDTLWTIDQGNDTPRLFWEGTVGVPITNCPTYSGGTGDLNTPYLIASPQDLLSLSRTTYNWDAHFRLVTNLDMTAINFTPIGTTWIMPFTGTFDGSGYTIANLTINLPATSFVGLFGRVNNEVDPNAVSNLGLLDPDIIGDRFVGSLAGMLYRSNVSECFVNGSSVSGSQFVGSLVGQNYEGTIGRCYAAGTVTGSTSEVGGLVGYNSTGTISNSYASVAVTGTVSRVGGLVGYSSTGTVSNSFWDIQISGQPTSAGGIGKTTVEMKQQATFTNWDFINIWGIFENQTSPLLKASRLCIQDGTGYPSGDNNGDCRVDILDFAYFAQFWLEDRNW